jgi:hypothetical protein
MIALTLVVIGKDTDALIAFDQLHPTLGYTGMKVDIRYRANLTNRPLAAIANDEMTTSAPVFGLVHADTKFREGALEAFVECAEAGNVCGIVGRTPTKYRWCHKPTGFDDGVLTIGPGPVCTLDSCSCFFRPDLGLRFDAETFDSFHCHVEDLCMQANERGIPVVVPSADATHLAPNPTQEWHAVYLPYRERLAVKWANRGRAWQVVTT